MPDPEAGTKNGQCETHTQGKHPLSTTHRDRPTRTGQRRHRAARRRRRRLALTGAAALAIAALAAAAWWAHDARTSAAALAGAVLFDAHCALCHGERAVGTAQGPPLVHRLYEPGHHPDAAFHRAVQRGVTSHHWSFGNMPRVAGVSKPDVTSIVAYVRTLQRARGIH